VRGPTWIFRANLTPLSLEAYRLDPRTLENLGPEEAWALPVSAHCKVDERTGELLIFNYGPGAPGAVKRPQRSP
jgi:carotenoid cleavage dioxygenase-like enzyme